MLSHSPKLIGIDFPMPLFSKNTSLISPAPLTFNSKY